MKHTVISRVAVLLIVASSFVLVCAQANANDDSIINKKALAACPASNLPLVNAALHDLDLPIPDLNYTSHGITVNLTSIRLNNLCFKDAKTSYRKDMDQARLFATVSGIDAQVDAEFSIEGKYYFIDLTKKGRVSLKISDAQVVTGTIILLDEHDVPKEVEITSGSAGCSTTVANKLNLQFQPSIPLFYPIMKFITGVFGGALDHTICSQVRDVVQTYLDPTLSEVYTYVKPYLVPAPLPPVPHVLPDSSLTDWSTLLFFQYFETATQSIPKLLSRLAVKAVDPTTGVLSIDFGSLIPAFMIKSPVVDANIAIRHVTLQNAVNFFSSLSIMPLFSSGPSPSYTLDSLLAWGLQMEASIEVGVALLNHTTGAPIVPTLYPQTCISVGPSKFGQNSIVTISKNRLENLSIRQAEDLSCVAECVTDKSGMYATFAVMPWDSHTVKMTNISAGLDPVIGPVLEAGNELLAKPLVSLVLANWVAENFPGLFNSTVKEVLKMAERNHTCHTDSQQKNIIDWRRSDVLTWLRSKVLGPQVMDHINTWIDVIFADGTANLLGAGPINVASHGVSLSISEATLHGMDTLYQMDLFAPVATSATTLRHRIGLGDSSSPHKHLKISLTLDAKSSLHFRGQDLTHNALSAQLILSDVEIGLDTVLGVDMNELENMKVWYLLMVNPKQPCVVSAMRELQVNNLSVSVGRVGVDVQCHTCSSGELSSISELLKGDAAKEALANYLTSKLGSSLETIDGNLESAFNYASTSFLSEVDHLCHSPANYTAAPTGENPSNPNEGFGLGAMVGLSAGAAALIGVCVVCYMTPGTPVQQTDGAQSGGYAALSGGASDDAVRTNVDEEG